MINLMSPKDKRQLKAARINVTLMKFVLMLVAGIGLLVIVFLGSFFITNIDKQNALQSVEDNKKLTAQYNDVRSEAEKFEQNLRTADTILSNEIAYSDLIVLIAKTLPNDAILTTLSLNSESFGQPFVLTAQTTSYDSGLELKSTLENSDLFSNVSISSLVRDVELANSEYPYSVVINATLEKDFNKEVAS